MSNPNKKNGPAVAAAGFADELQYLLDGEHRVDLIGGKSIVEVPRRRALQYLMECWEPVIVGLRRDGSPRAHWRCLQTGRRFSPMKLKALWADVRVDLGPGHQPGYRWYLFQYFSRHDEVAADARALGAWRGGR